MGKKYVEAFGDAQLWPWPILQVGWIIMSFAGETQSACTKQCWGKKGWCLAGRCLGMDGWMDGWMDGRSDSVAAAWRGATAFGDERLAQAPFSVLG